MKKCAEFSKEATSEVTKVEPIPKKLEEEHIKSRTTPSVDFAASNKTNKRSMSSAKPLREFQPMDWVPIDYREVFDKRRPFPNQKGMARALEVDFPPERKAEDSYDLETTGEIFQKLFGDDGVVVWTSLGPLPWWVPGPTTQWAPGTTRLALHGTCWREAQGLRRRSTQIGSCTCPALYRGLLDVLD
jgi:hypothetical protein